MLEGHSPKLKGVLCDILIDVVDVYNTLPLPAESTGINSKTEKKVIIKTSCLFRICKTKFYFEIFAVFKIK